MRTWQALGMAASLVGAVVSGAHGTENTAAVPDPRPSAEVEWSDLDPTGAPGVQIAPLWGDHREGAFGALFKLPAGFAAPLHEHSHDMKLVIVSGTYLQAPAGEAEFRLDAGSYLLQPGGGYRHTTRCDPAADCIFFVESDGAFDLHVVETESPPPAG